MIVHVKMDSESGGTIAILNINADDRIKHVKEQIEITTGIKKATQCLFRRFDNGNGFNLWQQLHGSGKVSRYYLTDGSTIVLQHSRSEGLIKTRWQQKLVAKKQAVAAAELRSALMLSESTGWCSLKSVKLERMQM